MRLFIAIDLDDDARAAIAAEQQRLKQALRSAPSLKWVRPEQMHLTLVFIGEVDEARAAQIGIAVGPPIPVPPFDLVFAGAGMFPPRGRPNVLWIGAADGEAQAIAVQREIASRVAACGVSLETRPFHPHLTLARWRDSRPSDRQRVLDAATNRAVARVRVDAATLYHSKLSPAGPTYTPLARAALRV